MDKKLDQLAQRLEQKHRTRLEAMTRAALRTPRPSRHASRWQFPCLKPVMATGLAASAAIAALLWLSPREQTPAMAGMAALPEWVADTGVPLTLLANMDFYDWLARQPNNPQSAAPQNRLVLADNQPGYPGTGWRHATTHPAERFSGGFARDGNF